MTAEECIDSCLKSHASCLTTSQHCLQLGGAHARASHLALLLDCAELCQTTANSLLRRSPQHGVICDACATVCEACARDCDTFRNDPVMAECARICRECAGHCRMMTTVKI
jgi:hypothetical protein